MASQTPPAGPDPGRWRFLRDVAVFQLKLVVDGLRDALLVPVSMLAALADLVLGRERPGHWFYTTVLWGRRSEGWIDLFEVANRLDPQPPDPPRPPHNLDELAGRLEKLLVEQEERGGVTRSARRAIDRVLDSLPPSPPKGP